MTQDPKTWLIDGPLGELPIQQATAQQAAGYIRRSSTDATLTHTPSRAWKPARCLRSDAVQ